MSLTYWGLSLFSTELSDDKMTGFFLSGFIEIPGAAIAFIMIVSNPTFTYFISVVFFS